MCVSDSPWRLGPSVHLPAAVMVLLEDRLEMYDLTSPSCERVPGPHGLELHTSWVSKQANALGTQLTNLSELAAHHCHVSDSTLAAHSFAFSTDLRN
jgi:hypothetical protein